MTGHFLPKAQYQGLVDVYVAIVGAQGAISADWFMRSGGMFPVPGNVPAVSTSDYRNEVRVSVDQLADEPLDVSGRLLGRLLRTIRALGMSDPLDLAYRAAMGISALRPCCRALSSDDRNDAHRCGKAMAPGSR
jgi:hypothetical protein